MAYTYYVNLTHEPELFEWIKKQAIALDCMESEIIRGALRVIKEDDDNAKRKSQPETSKKSAGKKAA